MYCSTLSGDDTNYTRINTMEFRHTHVQSSAQFEH